MVHLDRPFAVGDLIRSPDRQIEGTVEGIGWRLARIRTFDKFAPSSLDFFIYALTRTTNWIHFHAVKEDVLLKVLDIVAAHGAEVAFPTSTVHVPDGVRLLEAGNAPQQPAD